MSRPEEYLYIGLYYVQKPTEQSKKCNSLQFTEIQLRHNTFNIPITSDEITKAFLLFEEWYKCM